MKNKIFCILTLCLFAMSISCTALANPKTPTVPKNETTIFCPPAASLKKDQTKLIWTAPSGWKSYNMSFVKTVSKFLGAQWNGAGVGQVTCLYKGSQSGTFPVMLVYHTLALEPHRTHTNKWSKNLNGYRNCVSNKQHLCPFIIRLKKKQENIYKQALDLKQDS